jgi:acyl carrier protein
MSDFDFYSFFNQAAFEVSGKTFENLHKSTVIADLGLDSVALIELVGYIEEKLRIRIPDEDLAGVQTLEELDAVVSRFVGVKASS